MVSGKLGDGLKFDASYWVRNLKEPVLFSQAVQQVIADGYETFLELSPHPIHLSSIYEVLHSMGKKGAGLSSLQRKKEGRENLPALLFNLQWNNRPNAV